MRAYVTLVALALVFCPFAVGTGQDAPSSGFRRGGRAAPPPPRAAGRLVAMEVVIADIVGDAEPEMNAERLAELEKAGKVKSLSRLRLSALENLPATTQFSERVPIVTGRTAIPGFRGGFGAEAARAFDPTEMIRRLDANANGMIDPSELESSRSAFFVRGAAERARLDTSAPLAIDKLVAAMQQPRRDEDRGQASRAAIQESVTMEMVGTMVTVTARVDEDDSILVELQAEQSQLASFSADARGDGGNPSTPNARTTMISARTTVRVPPGKIVVAGAKTTKSEQGTVQTWILVSASAEAARPKPADEAAVLKILALKHAQAEDLAALLANLFRGDDFRAAVDARSNKLILSGNATLLETIIPLVAELDHAADEK